MDRARRKFWKQYHSQLLSNKMKCLGINLTKEAKDLYKENYSTLKMVEEDIRK